MEHHGTKRGALWLGLVLALAGAGCTREEAREEVRDIKRAGDEVESTVREGVQQAKQGAEKLKDELPAATQRAKEELVAVGNEVKEAANEVRDSVHKATAPVREELREADKK